MEERAIRLLEKHFKGISNGKRIKIILLVFDTPGLTLNQISQKLKCNIKTTSEHLRKLHQAGIISKMHSGRCVEHYLTPSGAQTVEIIKEYII